MPGALEFVDKNDFNVMNLTQGYQCSDVDIGSFVIMVS